MKKNPLAINIAGLHMKNPVIAVSGTFGYAQEYSQLIDIEKIGAIVTKTITLKPWQGNEPPRIIETPSGMLNAIGLENIGVAAFIEEKMPYLKRLGVPVIVSIGGRTIEETVKLAGIIDSQNVDAVELNISCPNIKYKNKIAGDAALIKKIVAAIRKKIRVPLIVKLSPNVTDIVLLARAAESAGADILSLVNTFLAMAVDITSRRPSLANITGGLSGPAIRPIALRMVYQVAGSVKIPVIGMGGIMDADDAVSFIIAGASAVGVGTANFVDPKSMQNIITGLKAYLIKNRLKSITELVGSIYV